MKTKVNARRVLTWEEAAEDLQLAGVLPPQAQDVVLPADHLAEDQHDGDGGQADEQEQRVGPLHDVQALLVAHHLQGGGEVTHGAARANRMLPPIPVGGATEPPSPPRYDQLTSVDTPRLDFGRHVA